MQPETIQEQQRAILAVHGCKARHVETVRVREVFNKLVAWEGNVEVYEIGGHPKAKRCYAWSYEEGGSRALWTRLTACLMPETDLFSFWPNQTFSRRRAHPHGFVKNTIIKAIQNRNVFRR